jgi:Mlc titration factor MtfA (ptsG expression regulator)
VTDAALSLLALAGAALAVGLVVVARARRRRRARAALPALLATPMPDRARAFLLERCDHYERLTPDLRRRFERDVQVFVAEKRVTGIGVEVTDELRLLVAASAATLTLGWPEAEWDRLTEVLLYPDDFDRDYGRGDERAGETHAWGTVILSVPALLESFEHDRDGFHVGLHEFAHLLDVEQAEFDGMPGGIAPADRGVWARLVPLEMERLRRGRSALDDYGAEDPVEFFPVAVEAFFELPQEVRRRHAELYAVLSRYFAQDPAALDDARGLSG